MKPEVAKVGVGGSNPLARSNKSTNWVVLPAKSDCPNRTFFGQSSALRLGADKPTEEIK